MTAFAQRDRNLGNNRQGLLLVGGLLFLVLTWFGSTVALRAADRGKPKDWNKASLLYLPSGKLLKPMALDFDEALAAILWVRGIQYFSGAYLNGEDYKWMGHILDVVTLLNPKFLPAYEFGGTILGQEKSGWISAQALLERGIREFPSNWQLPLYLAMGHIKLDSNYFAAAVALKPLSLNPQTPNHIRTLAATFLEKGGGDRMALAFLVDRYLHSPDGINRDIFLGRIIDLFPYVESKGKRNKDIVRQLLYIIQSNPKSEQLMRSVLYEYLRGEMGPGSRKVLDLLEKQVP